MVSITRKKLSQTQDSETGIAGVLGSSPEKTKAFALKTGIAKAYFSYEEVLADSSAGSVHLGVPNKFHFLMAKQALEAGKHLLRATYCEP